MNLHEIYATLLARGMPEHGRLRHKRGIWYLGLRMFAIGESDARDLLTCHAARHFKIDTTDLSIILDKTEGMGADHDD